MVQVVVLTANGEKKSEDLATVTGSSVAKVCRKAKAATLLGTYGQGISIWGWKEGKAGTENKHELPPPHDTELFFGDIIATIQEGNLSIEDWDSFYNEVLAFEDLDEEDEAEAEVDGEAEGEAEGEGEGEGEGEEEEVEEVEGEDGEEAEAEVDDDCYDDGDEAGGGSRRRAPRKKTSQTAEYRRIDMGLKARIKLPAPLGKRAPKWLTEVELEEEAYT
jgi:cobalamin biosynthesis protein CobT